MTFPIPDSKTTHLASLLDPLYLLDEDGLRLDCPLGSDRTYLLWNLGDDDYDVLILTGPRAKTKRKGAFSLENAKLHVAENILARMTRTAMPAPKDTFLGQALLGAPLPA